ncbi:BTAD domain-containing putative transcriptional regulator [Streptomyces sp. NPDC101150]|uniref:BTAD domain-containing putative transcriptional regulator n=1 Tax=Streptomyces sp. NPDC101150 TaxID=3366114 RepID=UPI0038128E35
MSIADDREEVVLSPSRPATLLSALLLHHDEIVPVDQLHRAMWGDRLPTTARASLQTYISRLRRLFTKFGLPTDLIQTVPGGYRIEVDGSELDLARFGELTDAAEAAGDPAAELRLLTEALELWRGAPLANVESDSLHREAVPLLNAQWLRAAERRFDIELGLGRARQTLSEMRSAVGGHPGHERFREQLVEALGRAGRPTEALSECRRAKRYFGDALGVSVGPTLRRLEAAIAAGTSLDEPAGGGSDGPQTVHLAQADAPSRLPADLPRLVGRRAEAATLAEQLTAPRPGPAVIVITGPPGVGKSALAVHLAHLVGDAFPGGRYSVPMGERRDGAPRTAQEAMADAFRPGDGAEGAGPTWSPDTGPRGRNGDHRVLVLLDDALSSEQIAPLLPQGPGSAAIVTSRTSLPDLAISWGAWVCRLGALAAAESRELLATLLGPGRIEAEPDALADLTRLCSHFPIALRTSALWLALRPQCRIEDYVESLRADPLSKLALSDASGVSVAKMLEQSARRLDPRIVHYFAKIAGSGPAEVSTDYCALLLGMGRAEAAEVLENLVEANFLEERTPGTYFIHEIFRSFALWLTNPPECAAEALAG